jgi:drug/metabolite transporter (DMT)-like permease
MISAAWRVQFIALSAIWGSSFLFIKVIGEHWPAVWVALGRVGLGALTLVLLTRLRRERLRIDKHVFVAAILFNTVPFTLFAYGEQHVSSIVAGLWNSTTPLWLMIAAWIVFTEDRPSRLQAVGLVIGFAGVALLLGPWRKVGSGEVLGNIACAGAALCYGVGFPYTRRYLAGRPESGVALAAAQLVCATIELAIFTPFVRAPTVHIGLDGLGSLLALGVLGSGIAYVLNYAIVRAAGAAIASTVTYVIPVFSTALGAIVLGETLHWNQPVGAAVLLTGIAVSQGLLRYRRATERRREAAR